MSINFKSVFLSLMEMYFTDVICSHTMFGQMPAHIESCVNGIMYLIIIPK